MCKVDKFLPSSGLDSSEVIAYRAEGGMIEVPDNEEIHVNLTDCERGLSDRKHGEDRSNFTLTDQGSTTGVRHLIKETDFLMSEYTTLSEVQDDIPVLLY